jgi:hypothetical protein
MKTMELIFAPFDFTCNLPAQRTLFKDCFPETDGEAIQKNTHYIWKFHSFPCSVNSWEDVCYLEEDLVGYYAALPYIYKIGKKTTTVGMVCDVMTSSRYRGKGIFTKLGSYSTNELANFVSFTMGYPIRKEVIPGHLKVGWKIAFKMPLYIKFLKLNSLLISKKAGFISPFANIILSIYNSVLKNKIDKKYCCSIHSNIEMIEGYESFALEWRESVDNSLTKDLSFARWRYSAPERNYEFLSIRKNEKMVGFLAFRKIIKENVPSYGILDYMVLPGFENCHGLINKVLSNRAREENVEALITMMSQTSANKYKLIRNGFLKSPFVFSLIIKNLTNEFSDEEILREEKWHLMWVDSDDL